MDDTNIGSSDSTNRSTSILGQPPGQMIRHRYLGGFTLLEIMLVVAIIAITVTLVMPNFSRGNDQQTEQEARKFHALVSLALEEATLRGKFLALQVDETMNRYQFMERHLGKKKWQPFTAVDDLRERTLPKGVRINLQTDLGGGDANDGMVLIRPSGEIANFTVIISSQNKQYQITVAQRQVLKIAAFPPTK